MGQPDRYQRDMIDWLETKWGNELMVPIFERGLKRIIKSYLVPKENALQELDCISFDRNNLKPGFDLAGEVGQQYTRFCNYDRIEPFVIEFDYEGLYPDSVELVEEFRLLFNLYYKREENQYIHPETQDIVATIDNHDDNSRLVCVHKKYLKRYLSVKGMAMVLFVNHQLQVSIESDEWSDEVHPIEKENLKGELAIGSYDGRNFTMLNAKKIVYGCPIKDCGIWPYQEKASYLEFIIGVDENGRERLFTCNPALLNNMADSNPKAPQYLTPVFFKTEVLNKYYDNPKRYTIGDGMISCAGQWFLYIDNNNVNEGYVSVYLGDLGRDLPNVEEQHHWRSYNKLMNGKLSISKFRRDFLAEFAEPDAIDLVFRNEYMEVNRLFENKNGWKLFIDLSDDDAYNFTGLRIPTNDSVSQFDMLILSLVKVMIDSLNEKMIGKQLTEQAVDVSTLKGGISKLERWFGAVGFTQYESHIRFLRNLQELRSSGTGHRKGKNYNKISAVFGIAEGNYKKVFVDILKNALEFLRYIKSSLCG